MKPCDWRRLPSSPKIGWLALLSDLNLGRLWQNRTYFTEQFPFYILQAAEKAPKTVRSSTKVSSPEDSLDELLDISEKRV